MSIRPSRKRRAPGLPVRTNLSSGRHGARNLQTAAAGVSGEPAQTLARTDVRQRCAARQAPLPLAPPEGVESRQRPGSTPPRLNLSSPVRPATLLRYEPDFRIFATRKYARWPGVSTSLSQPRYLPPCNRPHGCRDRCGIMWRRASATLRDRSSPGRAVDRVPPEASLPARREHLARIARIALSWRLPVPSVLALRRRLERRDRLELVARSRLHRPRWDGDRRAPVAGELGHDGVTVRPLSVGGRHGIHTAAGLRRAARLACDHIQLPPRAAAAGTRGCRHHDSRPTQVMA